MFEFNTSGSGSWWMFIPVSYVIYRSTRTALAFLQAVFIYWVAPIFYAPNLSRYEHRWTVVSGGTDGIGKAYTFELARRGLRKFLLIGRSEEKLESVKQELESKYSGARILPLLFDFNNAVDSEYADKLRRALGQFDIGLAVNSVGVGRKFLEPFGERPEVDRELFRVNAIGAAEFISAVLPSLKRGGDGQLVVLSSSQAFRPIPLLASYSATKSFISFIAEAVDREYGNVSVQCLTPALVATKMTFYENSSLFVVTPEKFAREAVGTLGLVRMTSGCFNHEIQLLLRHFFPWTFLKRLIMPIYWHHQRRMIRMHWRDAQGGNNSPSTGKGTMAPTPRLSKIPMRAVNGGGGVRNRA